jgi:hypothetical protein
MNKLGNPAVIGALANTPQGQKALANTLDLANNTAKTSVSIVKNVLGLTVLGVVGVWGYGKIFNPFKKLPEDTKFKANISTGMAKAKAEAIYRAMRGLNNFGVVHQNLLGLNANGFVRVYNEFGKRSSILPLSKKQTMLEWFSEFNSDQVLQLHYMFPDFI